MAYPIRTNKLQCQIDYPKLDAKYAVIRVKFDGKMNGNVSFLDQLLDASAVLGVKNAYRDATYILCDKRNGYEQKVKEALAGCTEKDKLSFEEVLPASMNPFTLLQLFFNSLARSSLEMLAFNNLGGHLYVTVPEKDGKSQIITVEVLIDKDGLLSLPVRTFTSVKLSKNMHFAKGKNINSYPRYEKGVAGTLKRKTDDKLDGTYILRQINGDKSNVPFFQYKNLKQFESSKIGILSKVMSTFKRRYGDIFELIFEEISDYKSLEHKSKDTINEDRHFRNVYSGMDIGVLDMVNTETSAEMANAIINELGTRGCSSHLAKRRGNYTIAIIHEKDYYGVDDIHDSIHNDRNVQCMTIENYIKNQGKSLESELKAVLHELVIKKDLKNRKITAFNWAEQHYKNAWRFIYKTEEDISRCYMMEIAPDGSFDIGEIELNVFTSQQYSTYADVFESGDNVKGLVEDDKGNINIIEDTGLYTVPKFEGVEKELRSGNNKLRNREKREELLDSILDIKAYESEGKTCYFVGLAQDKIQYSATNAALIRSVKRCEGSEDVFQNLLDMMNVLFVKNGQLTVVPFPFKYLREYCFI